MYISYSERLIHDARVACLAKKKGKNKMNIFEYSYQRLFQNLIIIAIILFSFVAVPLSKAVGKLRTVPKKRYEEAKLFFDLEG